MRLKLDDENYIGTPPPPDPEWHRDQDSGCGVVAIFGVLMFIGGCIGWMLAGAFLPR